MLSDCFLLPTYSVMIMLHISHQFLGVNLSSFKHCSLIVIFSWFVSVLVIFACFITIILFYLVAMSAWTMFWVITLVCNHFLAFYQSVSCLRWFSLSFYLVSLNTYTWSWKLTRFVIFDFTISPGSASAFVYLMCVLFFISWFLLCSLPHIFMASCFCQQFYDLLLACIYCCSYSFWYFGFCSCMFICLCVCPCLVGMDLSLFPF